MMLQPLLGFVSYLPHPSQPKNIFRQRENKRLFQFLDVLARLEPMKTDSLILSLRWLESQIINHQQPEPITSISTAMSCSFAQLHWLTLGWTRVQDRRDYFI